MDKLSNKELHHTVLNLQSELTRYKRRFADLVGAHKSLLKEKEVLESSLKALQSSLGDVAEGDSRTSETDNESTKFSDCEEETPDKLKSQLTTLMNSLATLSEEKSRMEASFQADKKQARAEKISLESTIKDLQQKLELETRAHLSEIETFKSKLIIERHQREKEHNDHGVMIRELQKLVAEERSKIEKAESNNESLKSKLFVLEEEATKKGQEANEAIAELEALKTKLKENKSSSGATASKLHQELAQLKLEQMEAAKKEQERVMEAQERLKGLAASHEAGVATLEARLAELSQTVGTYDRLRIQDQSAIDKLKDRLAQLEEERDNEKTDTSMDDLVKKFCNLKKLIENANRISEKPIDLKALVLDAAVQDSNRSTDNHKICREEYNQLKAEFECYKKQYPPLQRSSSPNLRYELQEIDSLKSQVHYQKERVRSLHEELSKMDRHHTKEIGKLQFELSSEKLKHKEKMSSLETELKVNIVSLETQLSKQRERALALIKEKDDEITSLKDAFQSLIPRRFSTEKVPDGFSLDGGVVLHYSEEMARRDVDLARLRKDKHQLEVELRDAHRTIAHLAHQEQQLSSALKTQIDRFEQCQSREGANLEYLKNVVLNYLSTSDSNGRAHMLNAITAVLKFTEVEKKKILHHGAKLKPQAK